MKRLNLLIPLLFVSMFVPGTICLYRRRWVSSALFFLATTIIYASLISINSGNYLISTEGLILSFTIVYGVNAIVISGSMVASGERWARARSRNKTSNPKHQGTVTEFESKLKVKVNKSVAVCSHLMA